MMWLLADKSSQPPIHVGNVMVGQLYEPGTLNEGLEKGCYSIKSCSDICMWSQEY